MGYFLQDAHCASIVYGRRLLRPIREASHLRRLAEFTSELGMRYELESFGLSWSGSMATLASLGRDFPWPEGEPGAIVGLVLLSQFADEPTPVPQAMLGRKEIADGVWADCLREMNLSFGELDLFLFASGWGQAQLLMEDREVAVARSDDGGYERIGELEPVVASNSSLVLNSSYI